MSTSSTEYDLKLTEYDLKLNAEERAQLVRLLERSLATNRAEVREEEVLLKRLLDRVSWLGHWRTNGVLRRPGSAP